MRFTQHGHRRAIINNDAFNVFVLLLKTKYTREYAMLIKNEKPLKIIGYEQSILTQDSMFYGKNFVNEDCSIMSPQEFKQLQNKDDFQYFIGFALDLQERSQTVDLLDEYDCDCVTYIHDTAVIHEGAVIGKGSCVANFSTVMQGAVVGKHCFIETYCLISHDVTVFTETD